MNIKDVHYSPLLQTNALGEQLDDLTRYLRLCGEFGCTAEGEAVFRRLEESVAEARREMQRLVCSAADPQEPDGLEAIRALRPAGPRRLLQRPPEDYARRIRGAFYGRMAGCTLGAALEFEPVDAARRWAGLTVGAYPPVDYWPQVRDPEAPHYIVGKKRDLTRGAMDAVPPDDDTAYTLLGLMALETYGLELRQEDLAELWKKHLPLGPDDPPGLRGCWWGERSMLRNLRQGMPLPQAGLEGNPNLQNIAAWTRADSYGYALPGCPEQAAALAYRDASLNHRRNGVYGAMFMAATISAAFAVDDPLEAVRLGLTEIPENCLFAEGVRWALAQRPADYQQAHDLTWARYRGMFNGSALTNALHVVMGLQIGQGDFTRTIGETVAMSGDNDCTGATAGSILGAVLGLEGIPEHWLRPFHGRMHMYLQGVPEYLPLEDVCARFERLAPRLTAQCP